MAYLTWGQRIEGSNPVNPTSNPLTTSRQVVRGFVISRALSPRCSWLIMWDLRMASASIASPPQGRVLPRSVSERCRSCRGIGRPLPIATNDAGC
jgi:hypothetical protein